MKPVLIGFLATLGAIATSARAAGQTTDGPPDSASDTPTIVRLESPVLYDKKEWHPSNTWGEGNFKLRLTVSAEGRVTNIEVVDRGFGDQRLLESAIDVAKTYRFKPATRNGVPIEQAVIQPFSFSYFGEWVITDDFRRQVKEVQKLIQNGDVAGAQFHAETMVAESVKTGEEYVLLQGTLATTYGSAGNVPEAIEALRKVTRRTVDPPAFALHRAPPRNDEMNYLLPDRKFIANMLSLKVRLTAGQGFVFEALQAYEELAGLEKIKPGDPRAGFGEELTAALASGEPLIGKVLLDQAGYWEHELYRHKFVVEQVKGTIKSLQLNCGAERRSMEYRDGVGWSIPAGWQDCRLEINGNPGTSLALVEMVEFAPASAERASETTAPR